jgi:DNA repair exonuclease SbcCD ATPase subunit
MRNDDPARSSSALHDLFAERQVYLRSGPNSHYVVLSRPLQIGVTIGLILIVAWLALASYSSVAKRFEAARLEDVNQSLRAAAEAAQPTEEMRAAAKRVPQLTAALAAAEAERDRAKSSADAAAAAADALRQKLALAEDRVRELTAGPGHAGGGQVSTSGAASGQADTAPAAEVDRLHGELASANDRIDRLTADQSKLQAQLDASGADATRLREQLDAAKQEAQTLRQTAETAQTKVAGLETQLAALQAPAPSSTAGQLAEVKAADTAAAEEVAQLKEDLAGAKATIATLSTDLEAAKSDLGAARQPQPPAVSGAESGSAGEAEVANLHEQLAAANQRISELEQTLANLAPLPPPPAPR